MKETGTKEEITQRLKSAIWITVSRIVTEQTRSVPVDNSFVDALTELVFEQAVTLGGDLESFAKLDNRVVITMRDLDMVLRRNEGLKEAVYAFQG
ncbi:Inner kinetochore subunit mhf1 [Yarrowia lipolytica]|nr:Inner kinetochore subunit mhf1 [Yarrowia lipolytica]